VSLKFTFIPSSVHINPPLHTAQIAEYLRHPRSYVTSDQIPSSISSQVKALGFRRVEACRMCWLLSLPRPLLHQHHITLSLISCIKNEILIFGARRTNWRQTC